MSAADEPDDSGITMVRVDMDDFGRGIGGDRAVYHSDPDPCDRAPDREESRLMEAEKAARKAVLDGCPRCVPREVRLQR